MESVEAWRRDPNAPAPGTPLGPLDAIHDGGVREFRFGEGRRIFSLLVVRRGVEARAYVNACPHVWLPLTYRHDRVVSGDGRRLICSNHAAEFAVEDGSPLSGPGAGPATPDCRLTAVPVHVDERGQLRIGNPA
ncbi:nitrite reductase/ring-hydroxylating ferredoxin subunit [Azospirillum agricola]|uniref:Rieske (2Fe-2S) protein n=1 Tax=Azospirillum agricola TaxID=1720247 RepID=UPI001AE7B622|nr:Rieske 2Fe-2S domain-containing protein [Azospirillum agricola]MBP2228999.1 nitrite reductase/ring-hydroxylating ferredoxin subunit [Azospirillum agricola]